MTEQSLDVGTQNQGSDTTQSSAAPATTEKTLPQSEVNRLVGSAKQEAYERGKKESAAEYEKRMQSLNQAPQDTFDSVNQKPTTMGGMPQVSPEELKRMIAEGTRAEIESESKKQAYENAQKQYDADTLDFINKLKRDTHKYPDFNDVVGQLELPNIMQESPELLYLYNSVDNPVDVLYDLAKNPHKVSQIEGLYKSGRRNAAIQQLKSLADSIKQNETAMNSKQPNEPLSQLKTSSLGADNGQMSSAELRRKWRA